MLAEGVSPLVYAVPLSRSVSDTEGKLVVREVGTWPLTQDLLKHEVRGLDTPPYPPASCPGSQASSSQAVSGVG